MSAVKREMQAQIKEMIENEETLQDVSLRSLSSKEDVFHAFFCA